MVGKDIVIKQENNKSLFKRVLNLEQQICELRELLFSSTYKAKLTGCSNYITAVVHKLSSVKEVVVLDTTGEEVSVNWKVFSNQDVLISSNLPLDDFTVIIF